MNKINHDDKITLLARFEDDVVSSSSSNFSLEEYKFLHSYYTDEYWHDYALEASNRAVAQFPLDGELSALHIRTLFQLKKVRQAYQYIGSIMNKIPDRIEFSLLKAEGLARLGMPKSALELLAELKDNYNGNQLSEIFLYESIVYDIVVERDRAFYSLKSALKINPYNDAALQHLFFNVEFNLKHAEAIKICDEVLEKHPFSFLAWYQKATSHYYMLEYHKAIDAYEYAYSIKDKFELAYRDCAEVCIQTKQFKKALKCYADAMVFLEPDYEMLDNIGYCYKQLGYNGIAKTFFEKAIENEEFEDLAYYHLAQCYIHEKKYELAYSHYNKAINICSVKEEYYAELGDVCCLLGEIDQAEEYYYTATELAPEGPTYWVKSFQFLLKYRNPEIATELLDRAEFNTFHAHLEYCRVASYFSLGERTKALEYLIEVLGNYYTDHDFLFSILPEINNDNEILSLISAFNPI